MNIIRVRYALLICLLVSISASVLVASAAENEPQYKQQNRDAIADIVDGNTKKAKEHFNKYLEEYPGDLESYFGLAVAFSVEGDSDQAMANVRLAVDAGLPFERFLAGPRDLLEPLTKSDAFREMAKAQGKQLLHGPLLGSKTDTSVKVWVRTAEEVAVRVCAMRTMDTVGKVWSKKERTRAETDFTAVVTLEGLKPGDEYAYALEIDGEIVKEPGDWKFRTFPVGQGSALAFRAVFGGGAGYTPKHERMWNTMSGLKPDLFLALGDNVYIDNPTRPAVQQYCYYRRQSRPEYRGFVAQVPTFAIWDDHDFTVNDGRGGPETFVPEWKLPVYKLFRNNWANPMYGGGEKQPGCWFQFSVGDVDFFMLDTRYYRDDPKKPGASMLGPVQKKWFLDALGKSKGTFKVLASSVPWAKGTKPGSRDTWDGHDEEREEIFSLIEKKRIEGVILISADRHRSDAWKMERPEAYPLYDFMSSRLTNIHTHPVMKKSLFGYNKECSVGVMDFNTTVSDPTMKYTIMNIDNEKIWSMTLKKSELSFK